MTKKYTNLDSVIELNDQGVFIPKNDNNSDYKRFKTELLEYDLPSDVIEIDINDPYYQQLDDICQGQP